MSHEEYVQLCRARAADVASAVLRGDIPVLLAPRMLASALADADVPRDDADFVAFRMIDSEIDALPVGDERSLWAPEALKRLAPEIDAAAAWATPMVRAACESVVSRFGGAEPGVVV
jgi:hypothetical protein